jgi:DNA polymerase-3 subunit epsilon
MSVDPSTVIVTAQRKLAALSTEERYEQAAVVRDRLLAFLRACARGQRLTALTTCPLLVAARRTPAGGWEVVVVRHGRLSATSTVPAGDDPWPTVDGLVAASGGAPEAAVDWSATPGPTPAATAQESECLLRWLSCDGARLVVLDGVWSSPVTSAEGALHRLASDAVAREVALPHGGT